MNQDELKQIAHTIRGLAIDAIDKANSGHPGLPLGCAEIAASLFAKHLNYNPADPHWLNRDKFVLSAGHGSMLLYAALHLAGFDISLDDLKNFRQLHSKTAGHPEYREAPGVETTTGPLGQGIATAVGLALSNKMAQATYSLNSLLNSHIYVLAGDGCLMEGISSEASSFAGHLNLDNVIVIYDSNDICLDGPISDCFSENVAQRYESYNWYVQTINGHSFTDIDTAIENAKNAHKPSLIIAKTTIGFGSPTYAGTSEVHGKALGLEENQKTKQQLGLPLEDFYVSSEVRHSFTKKHSENKQTYDTWTQLFEEWKNQHPEHINRLDGSYLETLDLDSLLKAVEVKPGLATRASSNAIIQALSTALPTLIGGSADLSCSDSTAIKSSSFITRTSYTEKNIKYGVREFAMGAIASGLALSGFFKPFCGTFLTFSDYMKNAVRLAALMNINVIYQFTHDSIFLGEDGPTHQPVEHFASLRSMPNLTVIRPADTTEVKAAWCSALQSKNPVALIFSRQNLPELEGSSFENAKKGGYILKKESSNTIDFCLISTGSEVSLAVSTANALEDKGYSTRVVSLPSFELFNAQSDSYKNSIIPNESKQLVSIEAASSFGWHQYIGRDGISISIDSFGLSAPAKELAKEFGFTVDAILAKLI